MKKIVLSLLLMVLGIHSYAQNNNLCLNVADKDNETVVFSSGFEQTPLVSYRYDAETGISYLLVSSNGSEVAAFALDKQYAITYTDNETPAEVKDLIAASRLNMRGNVAFISGLKANEVVNIFTANGTQTATCIAKANGIAEIDITAIPTGIAIIKAGNTSFKVKK